MSQNSKIKCFKKESMIFIILSFSIAISQV